MQKIGYRPFFFFLCISPATAFACPDNQYEMCTPLGKPCWCMPKADGDIARSGEVALRNIKAAVLGPSYAAAIQQSRNDAFGSAQPVPPHIRSQLAGYASSRSLNIARFKYEDSGLLNIGYLTFKLGSGHPQAVTLIDVIVFRGASEANDPALWAHELVHVDQYADWGVEDFGKRYARNQEEVERPAYEKERGFYNWVATHSTGSGGGPGQIGVPGDGLPPFLGRFCVTPAGKFGPGPVNSVGQACNVQTLGGLVWGTVSK